MVRALFACLVAISAVLPASTLPASAASERSLYLYYTHTKETARIVFKRNGRYVQSGIDQLNQFLRDWRRNEPAQMDPALFDLLWEVYQEAGSSQPIHIVSAYRSPQTNAMLASRSSGVADNSQHMKGKAIDFFIPGVAISKLREIGFRKQGGGVGYYPSSGSPFVHLDTGSVRAWPRMTTAQLREIFPDGRTLHIPSNGQVLSQEGYRAAQVEWQKCRRVPCNGSSASGGETRTADAGPRRTLVDVLFGGNNNNNNRQETAPVQTASAPAPVSAPAPAQAQNETIQQAALNPPSPPARPDGLAEDGTAAASAEPENIPFQVIEDAPAPIRVAALDAANDLGAPEPPSMPRALAELRAETPSAFAPSGQGTLSVTRSEDSVVAPTPQPRPQFGAAVVAAAYSPAQAEAPSYDGAASEAINELIQSPEQVAAADPDYSLESFADLFKGPIMPPDGKPDAATSNAMAALQTREGELFAPDIAHVTEVFLTPEPLAGEQFAFMTDPDNADFDPSPQPGNGNREFQFSRTASLGPGVSGFGNAETIWVRLR